MATRLQVLNPEYLNELKNGQSFGLNPADVSTHLLGHVGDRQRLKFTIRLSNTYTMGAYNITGGDTITLSNGASFLDQDFYTGGTAYLSHINGNNWQFDIQNISTDGTELTATNIIEYDNAGAPTGPVILPDGTYGTGTDRDILRSLVTSNGLVAKFGFVPNTGNVSFVSPLDNIIQAYKFDGLQPGGAPGPVITGSWDNALQGSNTGSMTCQFINVVADNGINKTAGTSVAVINSIQEFEVIQDFIIPEYEQGDFNNVQNQIAPDRLIDSLKQVFEFEFRQSLSDPNQSQFGEYNTVLGNVKYFNENYVDIDNQYSVSDVVLTDTATGQTITQINASSTTRITCSVNSALGTFLTTDPVLLEHTYLPNGDKYGARTEVYTDVWLYETLRQEIDAVATSDSIISLFTATLISANQIDLQFDITFTTQQQTEIQNGYNYAISIKCADSSLTTVLSDVSKQIIQASQYTLNTDIAGLASFDQSYFYTRPMIYPIVNPLDRFTDVKAWIQDGILYDWTLNLDLVEGATLEALTARLVAFNTSDNTWFEFDSYDYGLGGQVVTVDPIPVQNLTIDKTRGYDLATGDKLNFAKLQTGTYSAPNQPYTGQTAFRATWQDWLSLPTADTVFYNPAEPNNNLNKKGSNYSLLNGYVVCVLLDARIGKIVDGVNVITQYLNRSGNVELYDFGEQDGSPITWTGVIQTFDEGGADLGGQILSNQNSVVKGSFTPDIPVVDPSLYWGEVRIEPLNNPGNNYFVLSTLEAGSDNNPLTAPTGFTYAKIDIVGGVVQVCAVVDYTLLPPGADWCATVRFGLIDQSIPVVPTVERSIDGNTRQNNGDWFVFQQTEIMSNAQFRDALFSSTEGLPVDQPPSLPTGWVFKVSPTSAQPGLDAYIKSNWSGVIYSDWATVAAAIGGASDLWVYIESNDETKIDEGFEIYYEKPQVGQNSSVIVKSFPSGGIDQDGVIYFTDPVAFNSITSSLGSSDVWVKIQQDTPANENWTDLLILGTDITLASLNAITSAYPDGTKWALHYGLTGQLIESSSPTITFNFDYNHSIDEKEKALNVVQQDVNKAYRTDLVNCIDWKQVPAVNLSAETDPTDAALLTLLNYTNPVSIVFWGQLRETGLSSSGRMAILTPLLSGQANTDGAGIGLVAQQSHTFLQMYVYGDSGALNDRKLIRWNIPNNMAADRRVMIVVTLDGLDDVTVGKKAYYQGIEMTNTTLFTNGTLSGNVQPSSGIYYHGRLQAGTLIANNPNTTERIEIYDKELNAEEIRTLFNNPDAGRDSVVPNLFRSLDYGNVTGANVPDTEASGKDMTIKSSGSLPTNVSFY